VFWIRVQPTNKTWMGDQQISRAGTTFFGSQPSTTMPTDWTLLRYRWESGHVIRAGLSAISVIALVIALP